MTGATDSLFDLTGKTALVTGASRGIGKALALALAKAGCDVAVNARAAESLKGTVQEIEKLGRKAVAAAGDVTDEKQVKEFVGLAVKALGRIDILVNNAGVWEGTYFFRLPKEQWDHVMNVNLSGVFLTAKAVGRLMLKQRSGKIINISSVLGLRGSPEAIAYCASKAGVIQMTRVMAIELGRAGVQVNCLAPGMVATDMTRQYTEDKKTIEDYLSRVPSGRYAQPEELSGAIVFLASKAADHMTGQVLVIDGGESLV
ncbi:MAG: glucose 1-dehydrogenase [Candidatus Omnitrophica bacterium]|nr:glucose 1-dehydrogenase [Candidatus Omnitrophota bacterium]